MVTLASPSVVEAQQPVPVGAPVLDITFEVLDLVIGSEAIDGSVGDFESTKSFQTALAGDVLFEFNKAALAPAAAGILTTVANSIRTKAKSPVRIDGYTDSVGSAQYNQDLSQRRAATVEAALRPLLAGFTLPLQVAGHGADDPVALNKNPDGTDNPEGAGQEPTGHGELHQGGMSATGSSSVTAPVRASIDRMGTDPWNHNIHYHPIVLRSVPVRAERALDVGCGEGLLAQRLGALVPHVIGIDCDEGSVRLARTQFPVGVHYVLGDFMTHPFEPASFDFIASVASLHHMNEAAALDRMRVLLRPGGRLVVIGLARSSRLLDGIVDVAGMVANRGHKRYHAEVEDGAPKVWPAPHTYRQTRRLALPILPGARHRRHLLWRYSLVWINPAAAS